MTGLIGPPEARVGGDRVLLRFPDGRAFRLTPDEAVALANGLTDAVDELEAAADTTYETEES